MTRYLDAAERQLLQYEPLFQSMECSFTNLTIGGGTPLMLTETQLKRVFSMIKNHVAFSPHPEIIIETAPNQTTSEKLALLKDAGVTRVSMGIQSFSDEELKTLGRSHKAEKARRSLELLTTGGFPCVNVDFIYGVPGQSVESLLASLKEALDYGPDELFLYPLYLKHGARLEREINRGLYLDEDLDASPAGRNTDFVHPNREFTDCGFGNTISIGCGGRSYLGNLHFCAPYSITQAGCLNQIREYEETIDFCRISHGFLLSEEEQRRRYVIRHLLIHPGISIPIYQEIFHTDILLDFPLLAEWREQGLMEERGQ